MEDDRMEITIVGRKCTPKDTFKERAESKLAKVDKFFPGETHAKITATAVKDMITVEITLAKDGIIFRAESTKADIN
jgi:putative sigma-54 modulation protein